MNKLFACIMLAFGVGLLLWAEDKDTAAKPDPEIGEEHYRIYRGDGSPATMDELVAEARAAEVTFLGETHNDPVAHYLQELIFRRCHRPGLTLSLEMFETDVQYVLDEYLAGQITEQHLGKSGRSWKNYETDYRPLVEFAKENQLRVIAANAPRRYVNRVSRLGAEALDDLSDQAKSYLPPLPYAEASPEYVRKFEKVMKTHREMAAKKAREDGDEEKAKMIEKPRDGSKGLQAQSLWDASMAFSIAKALMRDPDASVMHLNGSFHTAQRLGIVDHLARYRPGTSSVVVTMMSEESFPEFDCDKMTDQGDFVIVTDPSLPRTFEVEMPGAKDQKKERKAEK
jgi:uncharacterized iron-regulated protein